jgi:pimeloyl-ACP methyl ester carboxylesterase
MQLCIRHPERCSALVLLFPIAYAPRNDNERPQRASRSAQFVMTTTLHSDFAFWLASRAARDTVMMAILATPPEDFKKASVEERARVLEVLRNIEPISARENGLKNDAAVAPSIPRYEIEKIATPTLAIAAQDDLFGTFNGARYTAEHIPGSRFIGYSTGGHLLVGHGSEVRRELAEFLTQQAAGSRSSAEGSK